MRAFKGIGPSHLGQWVIIAHCAMHREYLKFFQNVYKSLIRVSFLEKVTQCAQFFTQANFCKKTGAFSAKIQALDRQNSSLALFYRAFVI